MLTAAVCCLALVSSAPDYRKNLNTLFEAERSFARTCALQGVRDSFLNWFAPDAIGFNPHPHKRREELEKQEPETKPFKQLLSWDPKVADCSSSGDLGFTTGPYKLIDLSGANKPIAHGAYFSIWRKQGDGHFKVVLDMGTPMAAAPEYPSKMKVPGAPSPAFLAPDLVDRAKSILQRFEEDVAKSKPDELPKTLEYLYDKRLVAYRPGSGPMMTSDQVLNWWRGAKLSLSEWSILDTGVARSADLAYCYGKYAGEKGGKPVSGYFVHVWKCETGKGWHIVAEVLSEVPPSS